MATVIHRPRIKVSTLTSGLTSFTLGPAVNLSFQNFSSAGVPDGSFIDYTAATSDQFECGTGVYASGAGTLSRVTIYSSSASGAKVNFTSNPTVVSTFLPQRYLRRNIDYIDIHDFHTGLAEIAYTDITAALNAALAYGAANKQHRIRISPYVYTNGTVQSKLSILGAITWPSITQGETAWIIEFDIAEILIGTTIEPPGTTTLMGINRWQSGGWATNGALAAPLMWSHAAPGTGGSVGIVDCDPIIHLVGNNFTIENLSMTNIAPSIFWDGCETSVLRRVSATNGGDGNAGPAVIFDGGFWWTMEDCAFSIGGANTSDCSILFTNTGGADCGLGYVNDLRLGVAGVKMFPNGGTVQGIRFGDIISENFPSGASLLTLDCSGAGIIGFIRVDRFGGNADPGGTTYGINVIGNEVNGLWVGGSPWTGPDFELFKPGSGSVRELYIDTTMANSQNTTAARLEANVVGTSHQQNYSIAYPSAIDTKLLTAPVGTSLAMGTVLPVPQNSASWTKLGGSDLTTGILAPDGTTNAVLLPAGSSYRVYYVNDIVTTTNDWLIVGCWVQMAGTDTDAKVINGRIYFDTENTVALNNGDIGLLASYNEDYVVDHGWRFLCKALKVTGAGLSATNMIGRLVLDATEDTHYFKPCAMNLGQVKDRWAINVARSQKNSWSSTPTRRGTWTALDHQAIYSGQGIMLKEGVTAPAAITGVGQLYIEGGAIKMKLGDGTVRTFTVT